MKKVMVFALVALALCSTAFAQKPWSEWDKKDVDKMLNSSAWAQTQNETYSGQLTAQMGTGEPNQALIYNYRIRLFSARPVREAFARRVLLANPKLAKTQLEGFINGDYSESIVVALTIDGTDRRLTAPVETALATATTATLAKKVYLERKDGKKVWLEDYAPPSSDGTGAKFVFPRMVDGKPFVSGSDDVLRFVAEISKGLININAKGTNVAASVGERGIEVSDVNWKFKLSDMTYNGKLEY